MQCSFTSPAPSIIPPQENEPRTVAPSGNTSRSTTPNSSSCIHPASAQIKPYVNATHVELFYCIIEDGEWDFGEAGQKKARPHVLKHAITYPFLLNELLAASALHLSTRRPAQQPLNREEAIRLQSQALRLFNETIRDPNFQNIIAAFLFSALQGIATFFETFHPPAYEASDWTFFEKIVQSARFLQGVRAIVAGGDWWHFLLASDIKDILEEAATPNLEWSGEDINRFQAFRVHVLQSPGLDHA